MSITAHWTNHSLPTVYIDCTTPLKADDVQALPHLLHGAFTEADSRIDVILDMTNSMPVPQDLLLTLQNNIEPVVHEIGRFIIVGATTTLETVLNTLNQIFHSFGDGLLFAATAAEADQLLAQFVPIQSSYTH